MAKSKNASQHNQTRKALSQGSQNGIKRPQKHRYAGMTGVDPKFRRNARWAALGTQKSLKAKRASQADA